MTNGLLARAATAVCATLALLLLGGALADRAEAGAPITAFLAEPKSDQAGAHSDVIARMGFSNISEIDPCDCHVVRELFVNTPEGVVGTPHNVPTCSEGELGSGKCPVDSQVGLMAINFWNVTDFSGGSVVPLYNMEPTPNELARFAFPVPLSGSNAVSIGVNARTESDYGLEFHTFGIPRLLPSSGFTQFVWGVPGSPVNDQMRFALGANKTGGCPGLQPDIKERMLAEPVSLCTTGDPPVSSNAAVRPLLNNPTSCSGPLNISGEIVGYDNESDFAAAAFPALLGCDQLPFDPSMSAKPTTTSADSPSGLTAEMRTSQALSSESLESSAIKEVTMVLPEGFTANANAADGKAGCTAAQARFGTREEAQCPEFSKIGVVEVTSASLPGVLPGEMFLGEPLPGDRYRLVMTFNGFSLHVKLPGTAKLDPVTGQATILFKDLPHFNFESLKIHVFGAERGMLSTPTQCGTYPVETTFRPYGYPSLPEQTSTQFFTIDSGPNGAPCPPPVRPFQPTMESGITDNTGGAHTEFVFDLKREDGDQFLLGTDVTLPPGFSGIIAGIPYCPDATLVALTQSSYLGATEVSSPACPASRIGSAVAGAGAGSKPVSLPGSVYLAGPYKGAPLSLAVVVPAVTGPYDLGNVVTRVAVHVDPVTAQVSALSDPLPQIIEGVPTRLREVVVLLDRPNFAINPTNCSQFAVNALAIGDQGSSVALANHFQVANCGALDFAPKLSLQLQGSTKRRGHPALRSVFRGTNGGANLAGAVVAMPKAELLDNAHIGAVCTRVQFAADSCPKASVYGNAMAETPILAEPLRGPVYLRSSSNKLPDLVVSLRGQVDLELVGVIDTTKAGGLRTTFKTAPDAPVTKFVISLLGGRKGLLINSEDLCRSSKKARVNLRGQNGMQIKRRVPLQTSCGNARKKRRSHGKPRASLSQSRKAG
jgi:hypothetical protein